MNESARDDDEANPESGAAPEAAPAAETPEATVARLEAELAEMKDRALRSLADAENTRRRAEREVSETRRYGASGLAKELLTVADNLGRALQAVNIDAVHDQGLKNLVLGVQMVERELQAAFERQGIKRIDPVGQAFDHSLHQAMYEVPGSGQPAGTVVEVMQPGYVMHDRLLRPAMVAVAKGDAGGSPPESGHIDTTA